MLTASRLVDGKYPYNLAKDMGTYVPTTHPTPTQMTSPAGTQNHDIWTTKTPIQIGVNPPKGGPLTNPDPWSILSEEKQAEFKAQCAAWKDSIQSLLTFIGLFSAIVTGFITATYRDLGTDPVEAYTQALLAVALRIEESMQGAQANLTSLYPTNLANSAPSYTPIQPFLQRAHEMWFLSLTLSLFTAVASILCLQWIQEHQRIPGVWTSRDVLVSWSLRAEAFNQSLIPSMIALLPLFLLVSFCLFLVGLQSFIACFGLGLSVPTTVVIMGTTCLIAFFTLIPGLQTPFGFMFGNFPKKRPFGFVYASAQARGFWYILWGVIFGVPLLVAEYLFFLFMLFCVLFAMLYVLFRPDLGPKRAFDSVMGPVLRRAQRYWRPIGKYLQRFLDHLQDYWCTPWLSSSRQTVQDIGYELIAQAFGTLTGPSAQHTYATYCCIQDVSNPVAQMDPFPKDQGTEFLGFGSSIPERRLLTSWTNPSPDLVQMEYQVQLLNMLPGTHLWSTGYDLARYQLELYIRLLSAIYVSPRMECAPDTPGITGSFVPGLLKPKGRPELASIPNGAKCIEQLVLILTSGINTLFTQPDDTPFHRYVRRNDILELTALVLPHAFALLARFEDQPTTQQSPGDQDTAYRILQALSKTQQLLSSLIHDAVDNRTAVTPPVTYEESARRLAWMAQTYLSISLNAILSPSHPPHGTQRGWAGIFFLQGSPDKGPIATEYIDSLGTLLQHTDTLLLALSGKTEDPNIWDEGASDELQGLKLLGADERRSLLQTQFNLDRHTPKAHLISTLSKPSASHSITPTSTISEKQPDPRTVITPTSMMDPDAGAVVIEINPPDLHLHSAINAGDPSPSPPDTTSRSTDSHGDSEPVVGPAATSTPPLTRAVDPRIGIRRRLTGQGNNSDAPNLVVIQPRDEGPWG